jgi:hypothetical protein
MKGWIGALLRCRRPQDDLFQSLLHRAFQGIYDSDAR